MARSNRVVHFEIPTHHPKKSMEIFKKIVKASSKVVVLKSPVPNMEWFCMFTDIDGNIHGLRQTDDNAGY